jgi:hypothetical protein
MAVEVSQSCTKNRKSRIFSGLAREWAGLWEDMAYVQSFWLKSDWCAFCAAIVLLLATLAPSFYVGDVSLSGLMWGGHFHWLVALCALSQVHQVVSAHTRLASDLKFKAMLDPTLRRISLMYFLLGTFSMLVSATQLVIMLCSESLVAIGFGFYVVALMGLFLCCASFERFTGR